VFGFDSDRLDWNLANLQATVFNTSDVKQGKGPKDFLLKFDTEKETHGDVWGQLKLFAARHNALVKRK
jgi:hypothetical protein